MPRRYLDRRAEAEIEAMLARGDLANAKKDGQPAEPQPNAPKNRSGRRAPGDWQGIVEQRILEGMDQGLFDNLRGMGKPLNLDEDQFVPEEMRMAFRVLRSNGLAPLWVELNKEIREDIARMVRMREHVHSRDDLNAIQRDHLRRDYLRRIADINGKIRDYNIVAPSSQVHLALLIVEEELAKFDQLAS